MKLSFENLRAANTRRGIQWNGGKASTIEQLAFRAMELGGETGEALNVCKKLVRTLNGWVGGLTLEQARPHIAEELADVIICVDRVAEVLEIDLETAITEKFNKTSLKHGFVLMQECMTDADLDRLIESETKKENEFLHDLLSGFEWQRINSMHITEVEKELHDAGYTKERIDAGIAKCRALVETALAKRANAAGVVHGVSCHKWPHTAKPGEYLHDEDADGPYDVDGVAYCGRCHHCLPA